MSVVTERLWKEKTDVRCERLDAKPFDRCHYPDCRHTTDISHALNAPTFPNGFEKVKHNGNVYFVERED